MRKRRRVQGNRWEERRAGGKERGEGILGTYFGTTGSSGPFAASTASFHLAVQRHHLQPGSRPIERRLFPREAEKSRNSFVRTPRSNHSFVSLEYKLAQQSLNCLLLEEEKGEEEGKGKDILTHQQQHDSPHPPSQPYKTHHDKTP